MAKYLPKPLRTLYRGGGARAVNRFTGGNSATSIEIKRQCHEERDFGHAFALLQVCLWRTPGGIALIGEKHQGSLLIALDRRMRKRSLVIEHRVEVSQPAKS